MVCLRRLTLAVLACACAPVGLLALPAAFARATITHKYLFQIKEVPAKGPPPAEESVTAPGPFERPGGLAVDAGELYVADSFGENFANSRLDKFDASTGSFIAQLPQVARPVYDLRQGVAVGHGTGETQVFVAGDEENPEGTRGLVAVYGASGALQGIWKGADTPAGGFSCFECGPPGGVAVDDSGNPLSAGRVYVSVPGQDVVDVFEPQAHGGEKYLTQLTGSEPSAPFGSLGGVAVDQQTGYVLVIDGTGAIDVFEPAALGEYTLVRRLTGTPAGPFEQVQAIAVDGGDGDVYVAEGSRRVVDQFDSAGAYLGRLTGLGTPDGAFGRLGTGLAIDPATHDVYVDDGDREGSFVDAFGPNLVVPDVSTAPAANVKPTSATLEGAVNPDAAGAATCRFEWGTSPSLGHVAPCEPEALANGGAAVAVHAALTGLATDTTYYYRLQATNENGTNFGEAFQDREFSTPGPGVHEQSASSVTATSVTLNAELDPNDEPTTYYFQYGTSTAYGTAVPAPPGVAAGSGKGDLPVSVHLQGLAAGTTYHYRVVAVGELGGEPVTVDGPDQTFATQTASSEVTQPDGRRWEMVSPPNKQGAGIIAIGNEQGDDIQAAADGDAITYGATAPFVPNPAGSRSVEVTPVLSKRAAPNSWETVDLSSPHNEGSSGVLLGHSDEYKLFSDDLSTGLVEPPDATPLPPLAAGAEQTIYLREADGEYKALVTAENTAPGVKFGHYQGAEFIGATPDFSHVAIGSDVALTNEAPPGGGLFEWDGGRLELVSVLPDGEAVSNASLGREGAATGGNVRHAMSDDGARLIWERSNPMGGGNRLYLRDMDKRETVQIDAPQGAAEPASPESSYQTANREDSRVFFTSPQRLTSDATAFPLEGQADLYEFELTQGAAGPLAGRLVDLSVDRNREESAAVKGVIGASEDGTYVYFVAAGVLGNGTERGAVAGGANLYLDRYDTASGKWSQPELIAALAEGDAPDWGSGYNNLAQITARVSPSGRYLAFMSERSLTGYDNRDANSGAPDEEVYVYDANAKKTVCASCDPTGALPTGTTGSAHYEERLWDYAGLWNGRWVAGDIPGWTNRDISSALYQSRYLDDSGRLFFDSSDALVPADVNGVEDVYEYEPAGVGSCQPPTYGQSASAVFSEALGGCVALISAGNSSEESAFMDASETGGDVFFLTLSRLAPQDYDTSIDIYDAHECSASSPCAPAASLTPPPCASGDACKAAPTPQPAQFGAPSSETFSGAGNVTTAAPRAPVTARSLTRAQKLARALRACRGKRRRKACERSAKRRYGAARTGRAAAPRRRGKTTTGNTTGKRRTAR